MAVESFEGRSYLARLLLTGHLLLDGPLFAAERKDAMAVRIDAHALASCPFRIRRKGCPASEGEVKLGLMYTGKGLESKEAKRRRCRLKEKVLSGVWRKRRPSGRSST